MELESAKYFHIQQTQSLAFKNEIRLLTSEQQMPRQQPLSRLSPFLDNSGLLRVGGRLKNSLLSEENMHPVILPRHAHLANLIIDDAHTRTLHGSTQATLTFIRSTCWILGGRAPVRSFILKCVKCSTFRSVTAQQLMGQLPASRVTPSSRPFLHSGVDYAGPFNIKTWSRGAARHYKGYLALFVCLTTSALHLELVTDYSADASPAAYRRFTARRGICKTLTSNCGTNLKGADAELQRLFSAASVELGKFAALIANDGTSWSFNPPAALHFGGKWEAGEKSVKYHLRRIVSDRILKYEEFSTLLTQIEAVFNSRPLCPTTDDPDDLSVLTPGHFLIGQPLSLVPKSNLIDSNTNRLSRWQRIRQMMEKFWSKWSRECLQRYQAIYNWNKSADDITVGSLVLIVDERYPPSKWPLGRVIPTHPGSDNLIRVSTIKTQVNVVTRPITKLCTLPISVDSL